MEEQEEAKGCRCDESSDSPHGCPFKEDIDGDYDSLCNCCEACEWECAMDI